MNNQYNHFVFVKDSASFCALFDTNNWPAQLGKQSFSLRSLPSFPAQLSLIIKNVDLRIDFNEFSSDLKASYPEIHKIVRLKNKFQNDIKLIKVELPSVEKRRKILENGRIQVNSVTYDVSE